MLGFSRSTELFSKEKVIGGKGNSLVRSRLTAIPHFVAMFATSRKMLQPQLTHAEPLDNASHCEGFLSALIQASHKKKTQSVFLYGGGKGN